jgi:hypothetical protein
MKHDKIDCPKMHYYPLKQHVILKIILFHSQYDKKQLRVGSIHRGPKLFFKPLRRK